MPAPEIQISKDGLKLSYHRYLADSAAGFIVLLEIFITITMEMPLPILGDISKELAALTDQVKLFLFLLSFLLATPFGLFVHQFSWFLFGWIEIYSIKKFFLHEDKCYSPTYFAKKLFFYNKVEVFFKSSCSNKEMTEKSFEDWDIRYKMYKEFLLMFFPQYSIEHIAGLIFLYGIWHAFLLVPFWQFYTLCSGMILYHSRPISCLYYSQQLLFFLIYMH